MYQSIQLMHKTQFVRNLINRLPLQAAMGLAVAMFLSSSGAFANTITDFPSWEVGSEFNDNANPSGVWSYGTKTTLTGAFTLATVPDTANAPDVLGWTTSSGYPSIAHNVHPTPFLITAFSVLVPPHALGLHPGPEGEYGVVRFTAPADGTYRVSGQFYALDNNGTGSITDVWILQNNSTTASFSGNVDYYAGLKFASFTRTGFRLKLGDTLDFQVGYGSNMNYLFDSTGLNAVIEKRSCQ